MRKRARYLLSRYLFSLTGMGIDDLPDTPEINEIVDEIEDMLLDDESRDIINDYLSETITLETIQQFI